MLIAQKAIDEYLQREVRSFEWLKRVPREDLLRALEEVDSPPWSYLQLTDLWTNQLAMMLAGLYMPRFLFLADMGTGKSRVIIELIKYYKNRGEKVCALICGINRAHITNWVQELRKYGEGLTYLNLEDQKNRRLLMREDADIFLMHYPGLVAYFADLAPSKKKAKTQERKLSQPKIRIAQRKFNMIVLDESSELGQPSSKRSQICRQLAQYCKYRYALTGTPFGRDPFPLWNQFKAIDDGETLGTTQGLFRAAFYTQKRGYFGGTEYKFKRGMRKDLHRLIGNISITYTEGECQDLPERVPIRRTIHLPDYMETYYKNELRRLRRAHGDYTETKASFLKMRQLSSGFIGIKNDDTGAKAEIEFPDNPKLEDLMEVIRELPADAKMLIFHEYIWTGNRIARELRANKIKFARLHGGQKDQGAELIKFQEDPLTRFFLLQNSMGSMALNLQQAHYAYFFESSVRPIYRIQAERRVRRGGQQRDRVFIIDPVAVSADGHSIDATILQWLTEGKNLLRAVLKGEKL